MQFKNETYDVLKYVALIVIPAVTALVLAIGEIWGLDICAPIGATIAAVGTCLGACLKVSSDNYEGEE